MTKLATINTCGAGSFTIYHDKKDSFNPFRVYHEYREIGKDGWIVKRKCIKAKYANYLSCVNLISQYIEHLERNGVIKP